MVLGGETWGETMLCSFELDQEGQMFLGPSPDFHNVDMVRERRWTGMLKSGWKRQSVSVVLESLVLVSSSNQASFRLRHIEEAGIFWAKSTTYISLRLGG